MTNAIKAGAIVIKEEILLPQDLEFNSEVCAPGWKIVTDADGAQLDRRIRKAGWNFFCMAEEVRASAFGINAQRMIHRAIARILKDHRSDAFNALEIKQIAPLGSRRFPGIWYVAVSARFRHIQESLFLVPKATIAVGKVLRLGETGKQLEAAPILTQ
jgi:hypothetical protein